MNLDFSDIKVLLIGDFMIDHYIMGTSNRVSPEAPVPVVIPYKEYSIPGGAGNVAMNLRSMGANVTCFGVVGDDIWGKKLLSLLKDKDINIDGIDIIKDHPTTLKKRIYSDGKQVARLDREVLIESTHSLQDINDYDVCILSDYNKGVIKNAKLDADIIIVDPKKDNFSVYKNANIITPNLNELQQVTSIKIRDDQSLVEACKKLIQEFNFNYIVAKKGNKGITIVGKDKFIKHIQAKNVKNPDVTGAGDTVIAVLSVIYAKTKDIELSATIANSAAGIVVGKSGTATFNINDLK
tara:strand:+ start:19 stop:903 length:885 start_codon:yes stop_codon:yes gene_type:complete